MTNQPDAYTLAAQAAADRARAEALQRGEAQPGPGLQSPMRRLSKNPATRWVLSGVLLAAGTALAVDYLNVPLGAWMRYHAPVPGAGGKSVAQLAAEQSAAPQAKIDQEITAPAEAMAKANAMEEYTARLENTKAHVDYAHSVILNRPTSVRLFGPASSVVDWLGKTTEDMHSLAHLAFAENSGPKASVDPNNLSTTVLPSGQRLSRLLYRDNRTPAATDGGAIILLLDDTVVLMTRADYDAATIAAGRPSPGIIAKGTPAPVTQTGAAPEPAAPSKPAKAANDTVAPRIEIAEPATTTEISLAAANIPVGSGTPYLMFIGNETPTQLGAKVAALDGRSYKFLVSVHVQPLTASDGAVIKFTTNVGGKPISGFPATVTDGFLKGRQVLLPWTSINGG